MRRVLWWGRCCSRAGARVAGFSQLFPAWRGVVEEANEGRVGVSEPLGASPGGKEHNNRNLENLTEKSPEK